MDDVQARIWFTGIFEENARQLLGYALRRVADAGDAADVVAETFLVAWRRSEVVPSGPEARLWLYGVARRVIANQRRGTLRRSNLAERLRLDLVDLVPIDRSSVPDTVAVVREAMARLSADDRELLWLTNWEGLTPAEVAVVCGIPPGTARSRLHRARHNLRLQLQAVGWDERSADAGHVTDDERLLVQDRRGER